MNDAELLCQYADEHAESAFAELVQRHLPLVYRTALRRLRNDEHLAKDAAQQVFIALARKAHRLREHRSLAGWLYTSTQHAVAQVVRTESRRRDREQRALAMNDQTTASTNEAQWETLAPLIDDVLTELNEREREAVLLRFFEEKSFAEVGAILAVSADAARMRVERALEKMQPLLAKHGLTSSAAAIALALGQQSLLAAPAGLAAIISQTAITTPALASGSAGVFLFMTASKIKLACAGVLFAGAVATLFVQQQNNQRLRRELADLRETQRAESSGNAATEQTLARLQQADQEHAELLRARAQLAALPSQTTATTPSDANPPTAAANNFTSIESLGNQGFLTPRAAFATQLWAARGGDVALEAKSIVLGPKARAELNTLLPNLPENIRAEYKTPEELMAYALAGSPRPVTGMQVLSETPQDTNNVILHAAWQHEGSSEVVTNDVRFHLGDDGWKMVVPPSLVDRAVAYLSNKTAAATKP